jgi:hypothetical protein
MALSPRRTMSCSHSVHVTPYLVRTQSTPHHVLIVLSPLHIMYWSTQSTSHYVVIYSVHTTPYLDLTLSTLHCVFITHIPRHIMSWSHSVHFTPYLTILSPVHIISCSHLVHSTPLYSLYVYLVISTLYINHTLSTSHRILTILSSVHLAEPALHVAKIHFLLLLYH